VKTTRAKAIMALAAVLSWTLAALAADVPKTLPDPDGKPADMTKPVQVFILLGQSNMLGAGRIAGDREGTLEHAVKAKKKYPYLVDGNGEWTVRDDVRYVRVMGSGTGPMRVYVNNWLTIKGMRRIGPEFGIGHYLGYAIGAPVLILKSCIGNRSLGWDLLPPGSERFEVQLKDRKTGQLKTFIYAGYKDSPAWWEKGTEPKKIGWYAGMQYDGDVRNAKAVLAELQKYYPGAKGYEVAGFFFWQGDKDRYNAVHASRYEQSIPSSRATSPPSIPIPTATAAPRTATTAATPRHTWTSARQWAARWSNCSRRAARESGSVRLRLPRRSRCRARGVHRKKQRHKRPSPRQERNSRPDTPNSWMNCARRSSKRCRK